MGWLALIIVLILIGNIGENETQDDSMKEVCKDDNASDITTFENSFISLVEAPKPKKYTGSVEYTMLVRVRGNKYARQEYITVEAHNRQEAKQKAINMGYEIIRRN